MKHKFLYIIFISAFVSILTFMLNGCSSPMPQNPQEKLEQNHWYLKSDIDNQGELYFENNKMHLIFNPNPTEINRTSLSLICDYYIEDNKITAIVENWGQNIELYYKIDGKYLYLSYLNYEIVMEFK